MSPTSFRVLEKAQISAVENTCLPEGGPTHGGSPWTARSYGGHSRHLRLSGSKKKRETPTGEQQKGRSASAGRAPAPSLSSRTEMTPAHDTGLSCAGTWWSVRPVACPVRGRRELCASPAFGFPQNRWRLG